MDDFICLSTDGNYPSSIDYTLNHDMLIFLDKQWNDDGFNDLIERFKKGSSPYNFIAKKTLERREHWGKNEEYIICVGTGDNAVYNVKDEYVVCDRCDLHGINWRMHPDLIDYVKEADQKKYKLINKPRDNQWRQTEIDIENEIIKSFLSE